MYRIFFPLMMCALLFSCTENYRECHGVAWGTAYNIVYKSDCDLGDSVIAVLHGVDMSLSPFNDSSLVSRVNRGETFLADEMFSEVFAISKNVNLLSRGAFDPTVAPLVNLWGFGYKPSVAAPTQSMIDSVLPTVGIDKSHLDNGVIVKKHEKTEFDFSAIAKGYGVDAMAKMLRRNGCNDFMVEIGGEVVVAGCNRRGGKWRIMVDAPVCNDMAVEHNRLAVIEVTDCAVATSGNYRNFRSIGGKRVGHTINSTTGYPCNSDILSVTIVAPECALADAIATACMAMPADSAMAMVDRLDGVDMMLVSGDSVSGRWNVVSTDRFPRLLY